MKKICQYAVPGLVLAAGLFLTPQKSAANPDYTKMTGKKCVYCHIGDWTSGKYTEAGLYYKEHRTFKGYVPKGSDQKDQTQPQKSGPQSK
jgi:hypothetical protein